MIVLMIYIVTEGTFHVVDLSMGVIILLIVPIFWNIGHSIAKPFIQNRMLTVNEFVLIRIGFTAAILGVLFVFVGDTADLARGMSSDALVSIFSMGILFAFLHTCWYRAVRALQLSIVSFIVLPSPVVTAILTFFITRESLYPYHFIGIGGEILGMLFLIMVQKKKTALALIKTP